MTLWRNAARRKTASYPGLQILALGGTEEESIIAWSSFTREAVWKWRAYDLHAGRTRSLLQTRRLFNFAMKESRDAMTSWKSSALLRGPSAVYTWLVVSTLPDKMITRLQLRKLNVSCFERRAATLGEESDGPLGRSDHLQRPNVWLLRRMDKERS